MPKGRYLRFSAIHKPHKRSRGKQLPIVRSQLAGRADEASVGFNRSLSAQEQPSPFFWEKARSPPYGAHFFLRSGSSEHTAILSSDDNGRRRSRLSAVKPSGVAFITNKTKAGGLHGFWSMSTSDRHPV